MRALPHIGKVLQWTQCGLSWTTWAPSTQTMPLLDLTLTPSPSPHTPCLHLQVRTPVPPVAPGIDAAMYTGALVMLPGLPAGFSKETLPAVATPCALQGYGQQRERLVLAGFGFDELGHRRLAEEP